jgi:hypothetical protein
MTQGALFDLDLGENNMPADGTEIFPAIIYFSKEEHAEFKKELKNAIKKLYPEDYEKQNGSNALLKLLKQFNYGTNEI